MRTTIIPSKTIVEDITNLYEDKRYNTLDITVSEGTDNSGVFEIDETKQQEQYHLRDALYQDLVTKFPNYTTTDLWVYVDALRSGASVVATTNNYTFNASTNLWEEDIIKAKDSKFKEINNNRDSLNVVDIIYDGKTLQADIPSQSLLSGKIVEVQSAITLGLPVANLVWRDASNVTHTWATEAVYLEWLQGFAIAIANRTTTLYTDSWIKKAEVDALTLFSDVEGYLI